LTLKGRRPREQKYVNYNLHAGEKREKPAKSLKCPRKAACGDQGRRWHGLCIIGLETKNLWVNPRRSELL
jgi:hypothetical protein